MRNKAIAIAAVGLTLFAIACGSPAVNEPEVAPSPATEPSAEPSPAIEPNADPSPVADPNTDPPGTTMTTGDAPSEPTATDEPEFVACVDDEGDNGVLATMEIVNMLYEARVAEEEPISFLEAALYDQLVGVCIVPEKWIAAGNELERIFGEMDSNAEPPANIPEDVPVSPSMPSAEVPSGAQTNDEPLAMCIDDDGEEGNLLTAEFLDFLLADTGEIADAETRNAFYEWFVGWCFVSPAKWDAELSRFNVSRAYLQAEVRDAAISDRYEMDSVFCGGQSRCFLESNVDEDFVLANLMVRNTGSAIVRFSQHLDVRLVDSRGILLGSPEFVVDLKGRFEGGALGQGRAAAGWLLWRVPAGTCQSGCVVEVNVGSDVNPLYSDHELDELLN